MTGVGHETSTPGSFLREREKKMESYTGNNIQDYRLDAIKTSDVIGAKVRYLKIGKDKSGIQFHTDKGIFTFRCEGDCCSYTWIEHISGVKQILGQTILSVRDVPMPEPLDKTYAPDYGDFIQFYGVKFRTEIGELFVEFRNSSNGYYGGSLDLSEDRIEGKRLIEDF